MIGVGESPLYAEDHKIRGGDLLLPPAPTAGDYVERGAAEEKEFVLVWQLDPQRGLLVRDHGWL